MSYKTQTKNRYESEKIVSHLSYIISICAGKQRDIKVVNFLNGVWCDASVLEMSGPNLDLGCRLLRVLI